MESKRFTLDKKDVEKILVGAGVAMGGALLTYLSEAVTKINWGEYTPIAVAVASILVNVGRKFLSGISR